MGFGLGFGFRVDRGWVPTSTSRGRRCEERVVCSACVLCVGTRRGVLCVRVGACVCEHGNV